MKWRISSRCVWVECSLKAVARQAKPVLRCKIRERIQDDERRHLLGMREREAHDKGAAERLADQDRSPSVWRQRRDDTAQVPYQRVHVVRVVSKRIRRGEEATRQRRYLPVEQLTSAVHARDEYQRVAVTRDR